MSRPADVGTRCLGGIALSIGLLSGCLTGPDYHRATPFGTNQVPRAYSELSSSPNQAKWKPATPSDRNPRGSWWEVFQDLQLDHLEVLATGNNQELAAADARLRQAREFIYVARANSFPQVSLDPSYSRQRTSINQPQLGRAAGSSYTYGTWSIPLEAGWELDLWGRVRRQVEAARARYTANLDDFQSLLLIIQAEVATDYFSLVSAQAERQLLLRSSEAYQRSLELTRNRRVGGIATDLDVAQAESQLRATEAELPAADLEIARFTHALATLVGQPALKVGIVSNAAALRLPSVPEVIPSELLERRPDLAAAERRMAAANAEIGVAQTAFYPRIHLNGAAGFQSIGSSAIFDWPSRFWAVGPALDLPLFTGGRNRAQLATAHAAYDEAVAKYRQSVLVAFQEVEDQLAAGRLIARQLEAENAALMADRRTLEIANNRYRAGLVTYLEVAIAQSSALTRERTVVQLQGQRLAVSAGLVRALGGGWNTEL